MVTATSFLFSRFSFWTAVFFLPKSIIITSRLIIITKNYQNILYTLIWEMSFNFEKFYSRNHINQPVYVAGKRQYK